MTVSVLMSVYKSERADFFDRALNSVWTTQSKKPDQIILIQDGPLGEDLLDVIKKWQTMLGDVFCFHTNEHNLGLTKSLNIGLDMVRCDLIARMDTDDISMPDRFRRQHDFLASHPDVDIVGGAMEMVDENENLKYVRYYPETFSEIVKKLPKQSPFAHPAVMMRASAFKERGLRYDERYRNSQDIVLWFDALSLGCGMANLHDVVLKFTEAGDVYERRGTVRAKNEFLGWMRGIKKNYGLFTFKYVYPCARYLVRSLPTGIIKLYYNSKLYRRSYANHS